MRWCPSVRLPSDKNSFPEQFSLCCWSGISKLFEIKKGGGPWGTSAQNPKFNVCMFANFGIWILRRCTLRPTSFWHLHTKGYLDRYFALIKIFAQMWNNLSQKWIYVKAIIFASTLCVLCVCFVCAVCVLLQIRVIKYCACQKSKVVFSVLRRKKNVTYLSPRKTWRPFLISLRTMFFLNSDTE